jgi:hypothetical protein
LLAACTLAGGGGVVNWTGHSTLSVSQAAYALGVCEDTVRKLQARGALGRIPHTRANRIPKVSVDRLLEGAADESRQATR